MRQWQEILQVKSVLMRAIYRAEPLSHNLKETPT